MLSDKAKTEPSEGLFWFLNFAIGSGIESEEDEPPDTATLSSL